MFNRTLLKWREPQIQKKFFARNFPFTLRLKNLLILLTIYSIFGGISCSFFTGVGIRDFFKILESLTGDMIIGLMMIPFSFTILIGIIYLLTQMGLGQSGFVWIRQKNIIYRTNGDLKIWSYRKLRNYSFLTLRTDFEMTDLLLIEESSGKYHSIELSGEITRQEIMGALEERLWFDKQIEDQVHDLMLGGKG